MTIFEIEKEFLDIIELLEESEGELTEEIHEKLFVNRNEAVNKLNQYRYIMLKLKSEIEVGNQEISRIQSIIKNKNKSIERLEEYSKKAVEMYGLFSIKSKAKNLPVYVELPNDLKAIVSYTESVDIDLKDTHNLIALPKELEEYTNINLNFNDIPLNEYNEVKQELYDLLVNTKFSTIIDLKVSKSLIKQAISEGIEFENARIEVKGKVNFK